MKGFIDMFNMKKILDFSSGWGDRLIGFLASDADVYWGFDPNHDLHDNYEDIISFFSSQTTDKEIKLFAEPFEKISSSLIRTMKNKFDGVITSPPFFDIEIYTRGEQSIKSYPVVSAWLNNFLLEAIAISIHSLKLNGYLIITINEKMKDNYVKKMIDGIDNLKSMKFLGTISYSNIPIINPQPFFVWQKLA
jgi:hypothetical protein